MEVIKIEKCRYCGQEPLWVNLSVGPCAIACKGNKGKCDENMVSGCDFIDAINNWNEAQRGRDD